MIKQQLENIKISTTGERLIIVHSLETFETWNEMTNIEIKHAITNTRQ